MKVLLLTCQPTIYRDRMEHRLASNRPVLPQILAVGVTHPRLFAQAVATVEHALRRVAHAVAVPK